MDADVAVGHCRQPLQMRQHFAGAKGAVDAHAQRPCVRHGSPEGFDALAGQGAARLLGDSHGYHQRQPPAKFVEKLLKGKYGRLGIERVKHRLQQQKVGPALYKPPGLCVIGIGKVGKADVARRAVAHRGGYRGGLGGRAHTTRHKARPAVLLKLVRRGAGNLRGCKGDAARVALKTVFLKGYCIGIEGVGADDVGPGGQVCPVYSGHGPRRTQAQDISAAGQLALPADELAAAPVALLETQRLHHCAKAAVQQQDALPKFLIYIPVHRHKCRK